MKFIVKNTTIRHNKETYQEGSVINLEETDAKRLMKYLEPIPEKVKEVKQNENK